MKKKFDPIGIEKEIYNFWEKNNFFIPNYKKKNDNFCMVIPPPNITGNLHMGHAFQQTIMDIIIRYQRMKGLNTLWKVGTDHAGIATQMLVEQKLLHQEGKSRRDFDRIEFIDRIWKWKHYLSDKINYQIRCLGNSVDWSQERFTLDEKMSTAVTEAFILLYQKKLIYKSKKISHWDVKLKTVISDLEVEHRKVNSNIWNIRYPIVDSKLNIKKNEFLIVSTSRPETLFGDTAVAVHSNDQRYKHYVGKFVLVPIINRIIPIIKDDQVDKNKGTGCVKITPAHDFYDYEVGKRNNLPMINIFTTDGNLRNKLQVFDSQGNYSTIFNTIIPIDFQDLNRYKARKKVISDLIKLNLLDQIIKSEIMVPYGDRSGTVIEPMLTNQWYLKTKFLSKLAVKAVKDGNIQFIPSKYKEIYFSWMNNIKDWCISRQLWWGHRIPVWYDKKNNIFVGKNEKEIRSKYHISKATNLIQDEDVLDTWFSSGLWPFASLGWPKKNNIFNNFYPTDVLVTGFDIIFFWVSRMIMLSMCLIKDKFGNNQIPFKKVIITGLIRDELGRKMSKSKGNVLDPLDLINGITLSELIKKRTNYIIQPNEIKIITNATKTMFPNGIEPFGADSLRFAFSFLSAPKQDVNWDHSRIKFCRNFCNKLWNASRFVRINIIEKHIGNSFNERILSFSDKWILVELNNFIKSYRKFIDQYRFDLAAQLLYDFTWNKFCDWYLEFSKLILLTGNKMEKLGTRYTLLEVLTNLLLLAHPIIPYITECIWQELISSNIIIDYKSIMIQSFPEFIESKFDEKNILNDMNWLQKTIFSLRNIKSYMKIPFKLLGNLYLKNIDCFTEKCFLKYSNYIKKLVFLDKITIISDTNVMQEYNFNKIDGAECYIKTINNLILKNNDFEKNQIIKKIKNLETKINLSNQKLSNEKFLRFAPLNIIEKEKLKVIDLKNKKQKCERIKINLLIKTS